MTISTLTFWFCSINTVNPELRQTAEDAAKRAQFNKIDSAAPKSAPLPIISSYGDWDHQPQPRDVKNKVIGYR